jgi:hypothetical protein
VNHNCKKFFPFFLFFPFLTASVLAMGSAGKTKLPTPYLTVIGRGANILWQSDSMGGQLTRQMFTDRMAGSQPCILPIGGEYIASCAAQMSPDYQYKVRKGNQFADSRIAQWSQFRTTATATVSPTTGQPMTLVSDDPAGNLALWSARYTDVYPHDDGITEGVVISLIVEPVAGCPPPYLQIQNGATNKWIGYLDPTSYIGNAPMRFIARIAPGAYESGQALTVYLWTHQTAKPLGTEIYSYYVSELQCNVGVNPPPYQGQETTGTKQAPSALGYVGAPEGVSRKYYDLGVICYSNEGAWADRQMAYEGVCSAIDSMLAYCPRVVVLTPPPLAKVDLSAWDDPANDTRAVNQWWDTCRRAAASRNVFFVDMRDRFTVYAPATVMTDLIHPNAVGSALFVDAIAETVASTADRVPCKIGAGSCTRIGGTETGTWTDDLQSPANIELGFLPVGSVGTNMHARKSTEVNATVTYTVNGTQVALIYLMGGTTGTVAVSVDGGASTTFTLSGGAAYYHRTVRYTDGALIGPVRLPPGQHTVVCTVASGHVKLVGCVGF